MSTFQIFFTEFSLFGQYPLLTGLDYIRGARSGSKRVFGGYFGASQRSSRVPPFLPSNTFLCRCLCPFLPSHFSFVRSLSQRVSMAHPAIHFSSINIRVYTWIYWLQAWVRSLLRALLPILILVSLLSGAFIAPSLVYFASVETQIFSKAHSSDFFVDKYWRCREFWNDDDDDDATYICCSGAGEEVDLSKRPVQSVHYLASSLHWGAIIGDRMLNIFFVQMEYFSATSSCPMTHLTKLLNIVFFWL